MDAIGNLELQWAKGYGGGSATYIDKQTLCFACGNNINFVSDGNNHVFSSPGEGIGPLAVHSINKVFAFAELCLDPKVYVYSYPDYEQVMELTEGAKLEYNTITFSTGNYIATVTGVPEFEIILWNYMTGDKLCVTKLSPTPPTSVEFNPANWRQLSMTTNTELKILTYENAHTQFIAREQNVCLPLEDGTVPYEEESREVDLPTRGSSRGRRWSVDLPHSSIAGIDGDLAEAFAESQDSRPRVVPVSQTWHPTGDLFVGCSGGHLLKIDAESFRAKVLYNPSRGPTKRSDAKLEKKLSFADDFDSTEAGNRIGAGSVNCMSLHKDGLFVAGADGTLRHLAVKGDNLSLLESYPLNVPITSMSLNTTYTKLAMGSSKGSIHIYDPSEPGNVVEYFDQHFGNFVGVDCLSPGTEFCVSVREDGEVQVWNLETAKLVSSLPLCIPSCALACSPLAHFAAVGTIGGHVIMVDLRDMGNPRMVHRFRMHNGPVKQMCFDWLGHFLITAGNDNHVFVMDARPSKKFMVYGHTEVEGDVLAISTHIIERSPDIKVAVTSNVTENKRLGATKLVSFTIKPKIVEDYRVFHQSLKYDFTDESIDKISLNFTIPSYGIAITAGNVAYTIAQSNKNLHRIVLPTEPPKKAMSKDSYLTAELEAPGHQLPGGMLIMSPHHKWIGSAGADGKVYVRSVGALDRPIEVSPHDYRHGGVKCMQFSADGQHILTAGSNDGILCCYKWKVTDSGKSKMKSATTTARQRHAKLLEEMNAEDEALGLISDWEPSIDSRPGTMERQQRLMKDKQMAIDDDSIYTTPTPIPGVDSTWLEIKEMEAIKEEDKEYAELKKGLRTEIREMRRELQAMIKENADVPAIEKLGHHEFDLDVEEQTRLQAVGDAEVGRIREVIEFENLAKMYLKHLIKKECWDDMMVKGRALMAFKTPIEVSNYPMRARKQSEINQLEKVEKRRRIELAELDARKEITEVSSKAAIQSGEEGDDDEDVGKEKPSTIGSLDPMLQSAMFGGKNDLFYSQFELHTREQKVNQIILLQDAIYRIKQAFNKEFDDVFAKKEQELGKIKDRNKRIRKILSDLDQIEQINDPEMNLMEKPERLLTVEEHEVTVEKYLTPEQRKKVEEEQKAEEERRHREKGDNARERALDMMMGGVLEIKKEDELKKDVPIPAFMQAKDEAEWGEEEQKAAKEYEKKVRELNEEREKYRKQLETELKKLQGMIQDTEQNFDEQLNTLFTRKVKTEMVVYQEELKIIRLQYSLLLEEQLENRERELLRLQEHKKQCKQLSTKAVIETRKNCDAFRELYDILTAEDKVMDKTFKRDFHDVSAVMVDQLYKLFRRRPRGARGLLKGSETPMYDSTSGNPFYDRPSSARQKAMAQAGLVSSLAELDKESNMPDGCDFSVWQRLCKARRHKIESEQLVKEKALVMAEMNSFYQRRQEEDEQLKVDIDSITVALNKLKDDKLQFVCNLEAQLLLKQGQVEVDAGPFIHDYKDSVLIHRSVVEDLNGRIRALGESKISSMVESKDFRKGIIQLEWEHKKNLMMIEDLQKKMRDLTMMKVTRQIQEYLNEEDHEAKRIQDIATLEQTLVMQKKNHEKMVNDRKRIVKELKYTIRLKKTENNGLDDTVEELNVTVNERNHINDVNADKTGDAGAEKRYQEIVQRRKLVDLAKAQAQEVAVLRAEVERLRMRTFPALVQVEH